MKTVLMGIEPDTDKRSCWDCKYLYSAVSWWCGIEQAIVAHNSRLPGYRNCTFWSPAPKYEDLPLWERIKIGFGVSGYLPLRKKVQKSDFMGPKGFDGLEKYYDACRW